jgi:ankyrin repeat protein
MCEDIILGEKIRIKKIINKIFYSIEDVKNFIEIKLYIDEIEDYSNIIFEDNYTPLHHACIYHNLEVAMYLIQKGININIIDNLFHMSPLLNACYYCAEDIALNLIDLGANIDYRNRENYSAYDYAMNNKVNNPSLLIIIRNNEIFENRRLDLVIEKIKEKKTEQIVNIFDNLIIKDLAKYIVKFIY